MRRLLLILVALLVPIGLALAPVTARTLGRGHAPHPGFSGYVASDGSELGVGRLAPGRWGICLDTGASWKWPDKVPPSHLVVDPMVGYLTSRWLPDAPRDPMLAAALWWAVGERLNSHPLRVSAHITRMQRETPRRAKAITALHDGLVHQALMEAPPTAGYAAPRVKLTRAEVGEIGIRSATGHWVAGLPVRVSTTGATLPGGRSSWTGTTGASPLALALQPTGPTAITVTVTIDQVPTSRFRLFTPRADRRQRVAAIAPRTELSSRASVAFTPAQPFVATAVNRQNATAGAVLTDRVTVSGLVPGTPAVPGEWLLLGPVAADTSRSCRRVRWDRAPVAGRGTFAVDRNGATIVGSTRASRGGCYTYRERLLPTPYSRAVPWTAPGIVTETALVRPSTPSIPRHPLVDTGGESDGTLEPAERRAIRRIGVPAIGLAAPLAGRSFVGRTLRPPHDITRAGQWNGGAPVAAVVGTTVIVGHVSDDHDRKGPFSRLQRAKVGQRVVVVDGGLTTSWRITAIRRVARDRLPRSYFEQGVERRLVLITCTDRVTTAHGGFHYRKNLIVVATPS